MRLSDLSLQMKRTFLFEYQVYATNCYAINYSIFFLGSFGLGFWNPMR